MNNLKSAAKTRFVLLLVFSVLIVGTAAVVSSGEGLNSLSFNIDGTYMEEPAVFSYWFDKINTENELFRMTVTSKQVEDEVLLEWLIDKGNQTSYYKDRENTGGTWQTVPYMSSLWSRFRDPVLSERGADFWLGLEGEEEYIVMEDEQGQEQEVKIYDIKVNEPIDSGIFEPQ